MPLTFAYRYVMDIATVNAQRFWARRKRWHIAWDHLPTGQNRPSVQRAPVLLGRKRWYGNILCYYSSINNLIVLYWGVLLFVCFLWHSLLTVSPAVLFQCCHFFCDLARTRAFDNPRHFNINIDWLINWWVSVLLLSLPCAPYCKVSRSANCGVTTWPANTSCLNFRFPAYLMLQNIHKQMITESQL